MALGNRSYGIIDVYINMPSYRYIYLAMLAKTAQSPNHPTCSKRNSSSTTRTTVPRPHLLFLTLARSRLFRTRFHLGPGSFRLDSFDQLVFGDIPAVAITVLLVLLAFVRRLVRYGLVILLIRIVFRPSVRPF